ncbi:MAG: cation transporter [Nanoarchaeota archaeon]
MAKASKGGICCSDDNDKCEHDQALKLAYFTVIYNIIEGIVSVVFGAGAGSIALIGFGLDSFVESLSGAVIVWRFTRHKKLNEKEALNKEKRAIRLVAYSFFFLAAYVLYESSSKLYFKEKPTQSMAGIFIAGISIVVMLFLFSAKQKTGKAINSRSVIVDSKQTLVCIFLSIALLIGVGLNFVFGFWQADPLVGILIALFLAKEGYHALKEEKLDCC